MSNISPLTPESPVKEISPQPSEYNEEISVFLMARLDARAEGDPEEKSSSAEDSFNEIKGSLNELNEGVDWGNPERMLKRRLLVQGHFQLRWLCQKQCERIYQTSSFRHSAVYQRFSLAINVSK
jgi:hypothetical protein